MNKSKIHNKTETKSPTNSNFLENYIKVIFIMIKKMKNNSDEPNKLNLSTDEVHFLKHLNFPTTDFRYCCTFQSSKTKKNKSLGCIHFWE